MMNYLLKQPGSESLPQTHPSPERHSLWLQPCTDFQLVEHAPKSVMPEARPWFRRNAAANDPDAAAATHRLGRSATGVREFLRTLGVIVAACVLTASCAALTEDERADRDFERENRLVLAREAYAKKAVACRQAGGMMQIKKSNIRGFDYHDYKFARCVRF